MSHYTRIPQMFPSTSSAADMGRFSQVMPRYNQRPHDCSTFPHRFAVVSGNDLVVGRKRVWWGRRKVANIGRWRATLRCIYSHPRVSCSQTSGGLIAPAPEEEPVPIIWDGGQNIGFEKMTKPVAQPGDNPESNDPRPERAVLCRPVGSHVCSLPAPGDPVGVRCSGHKNWRKREKEKISHMLTHFPTTPRVTVYTRLPFYPGTNMVKHSVVDGT